MARAGREAMPTSVKELAINSGSRSVFAQSRRPEFSPVAHFPDKNNGNFLICNTIGFLGVLQHEVKYNGADIYAEEVEPILVSADPNFRPSDVEVGGDGALYVSDWSNTLIGHMQHNMRDPNRDHEHGRIYRVTYKGRPLVKPVKLKGKPIATVLKTFFAKENSARYRARLELSGRDTNDVIAEVSKFAASLDPSSPGQAQALLECLWTYEEHRVPNHDLIKKIFAGAEDGRVRAAAIRTLGHWGTKLSDWGANFGCRGARSICPSSGRSGQGCGVVSGTASCGNHLPSCQSTDGSRTGYGAELRQEPAQR